MKKYLSFLVIVFVFISALPVSAASEPYNHEELLEYEGYGEAMFESVTRSTAYVAGSYTDKKDYIDTKIQSYVDYVNFVDNELSNIDGLKDAISTYGGLFMNIPDAIKGIFGDYDEEVNGSSGSGVPNIDFSQFEDAFREGRYSNDVRLNTGWTGDLITPNGSYSITGDVSASLSGSSGKIDDPNSDAYYWMTIQLGSADVYTSNTVRTTRSAALPYFDYFKNDDTVADRVRNIYLAGGTFSLKYNGVPKLVVEDFSDPDSRTINNFINQDGGLDNKQIAVPQPRPYLSCPDGTKVQMSISGSTFLAVDGTTMIVNKDGTAEVNSAICNLGWDVPNVMYDPLTERPVIETPDGNYQDIETGEVPGAIDEDISGCDTTLCGIGKMLTGLGDIAKSIAGLVTKLLDGLLKLFVPEDLDFVTESFDSIKKVFDEKLGVVNVLKDSITSAFEQGESNPLQDLTLDLPILEGKSLDVIDMSLVDEYVPTVKRVMSGIMILTTILYLYRKITGRGGVMEK